MKTIIKKMSYSGVAILLLCCCFGVTGCSSSPYYGGQGSPVHPMGYVPSEVQRTEPWLPVW
jgi:hypothetical protein